MMENDSNYTEVILPPEPSDDELREIHSKLSQQKLQNRDSIAVLELAYPFLAPKVALRQREQVS